MWNEWWAEVGLYVHRRLSYNEVVPACAMEADRLSGSITPLIYKCLQADLSGHTVCPGHFTAREMALVLVELEAGCALELAWMFWRKDSSLAPSKIWTPDFPAYILVTVLTMLPLTDLKVIQKSVLINRDGRLGLDAFGSWQEFQEGFSEHSDFCELCKREFLIVNRV
jgi:hypothetical protein